MATALLEKQNVEKAVEAEAEPTPYHWTVDAFYHAINNGVFKEPERLELIQGRIVENMGQNPPHRAFRVRLARRFQAFLQPRFFVVEECPVRITEDTEPTPDIVVLIGQEADYDDRHPTPPNVVVAVEVSDSTANYDLEGKARMYAQAGIAEYWVVLVRDGSIIVHRDPTPSGYQNVVRVSGADTVSLLAAPELVWTVEALLGREEAAREN